MAINLMCTNSKCKYYWEDNCTKNLNEERLEIDTNGTCITFEEGISEFYTDNPPYSPEDYELAKSQGLDLDDWKDYVEFYGLGEEESYD